MGLTKPIEQNKLSYQGTFMYLKNIIRGGSSMNTQTEKLRQKYIDNPPEGMTSEDIRRMSEDDLLDMDYFLNEDGLFDNEAGVEGFFIF